MGDIIYHTPMKNLSDATVEARRGANVLVDIDLSILGTDAARLEEYEQQVREEYAWVPDFLFRRTRGKILQGFLARQGIYATAHFHDRLEKKRERISRALYWAHPRFVNVRWQPYSRALRCRPCAKDRDGCA